MSYALARRMQAVRSLSRFERFVVVAVIALLSALAGFGAANIFRPDELGAGMSAFKLKQDGRALAAWRAQAASVEASIAYLHEKGLGANRDERAASEHYALAMSHDERAAQHAMGMMYLTRPVESDDFIHAHVLCDLAWRGGLSSALACRERAALRLSQSDLAQASSLAAEWGTRDHAGLKK